MADPAFATARNVDELTEVALPGLPATCVDRTESRLLVDTRTCDGDGLIERLASPVEVDNGCELGIAFDPCPGCENCRVHGAWAQGERPA